MIIPNNSTERIIQKLTGLPNNFLPIINTPNHFLKNEIKQPRSITLQYSSNLKY